MNTEAIKPLSNCFTTKLICNWFKNCCYYCKKVDNLQRLFSCVWLLSTATERCTSRLTAVIQTSRYQRSSLASSTSNSWLESKRLALLTSSIITKTIPVYSKWDLYCGKPISAHWQLTYCMTSMGVIAHAQLLHLSYGTLWIQVWIQVPTWIGVPVNDD